MKRALEMLSQATERFEPIDAFVRSTAKQRPFLALAGVLGASYLLGRLIRRLY